ncbi:tachykinins isoform X2 [Wyeomyia smithii]|nr:tachykinins isoform X2 [Wyeomyia smithii]
MRKKRSLSLNGKSITSYSHINHIDNDVTTSSPSLESLNNVASSNMEDNEAMDAFDEKSDLFRNTVNSWIPESVFESVEGAEPLETDNDYRDLRGKKFFSMFPLRSSPKRAPSGFVGLRGKKLYSEVKRAPSGFMGVRGKKYNYINSNQLSSAPADLEFYDLLKKEEKILKAIYDINSVDNEQHSYDASILNAEKRVPHGFLGLRGKKLFDQPYQLWEEKRAPSGFVGLRGKRQSPLDTNDKFRESAYSLSLASNEEKDSTISMAT